MNYISIVLILIVFQLVIIITGTSFSQIKVTNNEISKLEWLKGTWVGELDNGTYTETWAKKDEGAYESWSYFIVGKDTLSKEYARLEILSGFLCYIPVADEQVPVLFYLIKNDGNEWLFENKKLNFPRNVLYSLKEDGSLYAKVEGIFDGKEKKLEFNLKKM